MSEAIGSTNRELDDRLKSTLDAGMNTTPQYKGSLAELVWAQIADVATDLEAFAKLAGRSTIKADEVLLLARRNDGLEIILKQQVEEIKSINAQKAKWKRNGNETDS